MQIGGLQFENIVVVRENPDKQPRDDQERGDDDIPDDGTEERFDFFEIKCEHAWLFFAFFCRGTLLFLVGNDAVHGITGGTYERRHGQLGAYSLLHPVLRNQLAL